GMAAPQTVPVEVPDVTEVPDLDKAWVTVVWNDPVNLMSYVTWVFQKLFGYSKEKAEQLMLDGHHKGRAVVSSGARGRMECDATRLAGYGLGATNNDGPFMPMSRRPGAECGARFTPQEAQVLRQCVAELAALLADHPDPDDPAVERLFPDVSPEDPAAAADFRRFTESDLKAAKLDPAT